MSGAQTIFCDLLLAKNIRVYGISFSVLSTFFKTPNRRFIVKSGYSLLAMNQRSRYYESTSNVLSGKINYKFDLLQSIHVVSSRQNIPDNSTSLHDQHQN